MYAANMEKVQPGEINQIERGGNSKLKCKCEVRGNDFARDYNLGRRKMDRGINLENLIPPSKYHICRNQFSLNSGLEMQSIVHGSNPNSKCSFKCHVCGKQYTRKCNLKSHMKVHETNADLKWSYKCDVCGKQFTQKRNLKKHVMNVHETNPDLKRHLAECGVCGKRFKWISSLKIHLRIHATDPDLKWPFKCDVCGNQFTQKHCLKEHMIIHETDPELRWPFKCEVCGNKFSQNSNLKQHMRIHETDPNLRCPFKCDACKKQYYKKSSFEKHMRKFHKNDPDLRYSSQNDISKEPLIRMKDGLETLKINMESGTDFEHLSIRDTCDGAFIEEYNLRNQGMSHESNTDSEYCFQFNMYDGRFEESDPKLISMNQETYSDLPVLDALCEENLDSTVHIEAQNSSSGFKFPSISDGQICKSGFPARATCNEEWIDDFLVKSFFDFCHST